MPYGWISNFRNEDNELVDFPRAGVTGIANAHGTERFLTYDRNWALTYYVRMMSNISETEKFILNQSQVWVVTKSFGFRVFDPEAIWMIAMHARPAKAA